MTPRKKVPVVRTTAVAMDFRAILQHNASDRSTSIRKSQASPSIILRFVLRFRHGEHRLAVYLAVCLSSRALHSGAFATVQQPELNTGRIGNAAHHTIQRIDLAHQMAFAQAPQWQDCRTSRQSRLRVNVTRAVCAPMRAAA